LFEHFDSHKYKMSAVTAPVSASATAKVTKKRAGGSAKAKHFDHPKYSDMIKNALTALKVCNLNALV